METFRKALYRGMGIPKGSHGTSALGMDLLYKKNKRDQTLLKGILKKMVKEHLTKEKI
jgi:hypothetical protein